MAIGLLDQHAMSEDPAEALAPIKIVIQSKYAHCF